MTTSSGGGRCPAVLAACGSEPKEALFGPLFEELDSHFAEPGMGTLSGGALRLDALHGSYRLAVVSNFDRRLYPVLRVPWDLCAISRPS